MRSPVTKKQCVFGVTKEVNKTIKEGKFYDFTILISIEVVDVTDMNAKKPDESKEVAIENKSNASMNIVRECDALAHKEGASGDYFYQFIFSF